ncbi:hypothetical protein DFR86_04470 [Acidianus sulfidivorans JP7]|uniref:Uncharacterized protein n=1 Tax=Acidianus sulfidivorans JP7 TaxID=619593 RepID=A0A2U9ILJ3_9CREN|nr:hypothetical protein [Acidianus sulfidivorans]AWR96883.1 hypothetical protein DFR86_04470 [Acidianus sulfidivorans JP7]
MPFYVFNDIAVDGFFMDKISAPEDRIYLITSTCKNEEVQGITPIPIERILELLREGYSLLHLEKLSIDKIDIIETIYNPSSYTRRREKEIQKNLLTKMYINLYNNLFKKISDSKYRLAWYKVELKNDLIYICNSLSKSYTLLYSRDKIFRNNFNKYLD